MATDYSQYRYAVLTLRFHCFSQEGKEQQSAKKKCHIHMVAEKEGNQEMGVPKWGSAAMCIRPWIRVIYHPGIYYGWYHFRLQVAY